MCVCAPKSLNVCLPAYSAGYYSFAYAHEPVGWHPQDVQVNYTAYAWNESRLRDMPAELKEHFPTPFDDVLLNTGLWMLDEFTGSVELAQQQLKDFPGLLRPGKLPIWMSTTRLRDDPDNIHPDDIGTKAAAGLGWPILDRRVMTLRLDAALQAINNPIYYGWCDSAHFQSYVYANFNNAMLQLMCDRVRSESSAAKTP
jgi:hypothetical protein